jgi:uncharacterized damage-inducible protein DinB
MPRRQAASLATWRRDAARRLAATRAATLRFVGRLPEREILRPRTQDRWSVKDVLGHLLACDEETVRRLRLIERGQGQRIHWFESMADADRFNARTVARARRLGLRSVLRRMARVRADLIARLQSLPLASLRDPSHAYPMVEWLPEAGWTHEQDHLREIRTWWRSARRVRLSPGGGSTTGPGRPAR